MRLTIPRRIIFPLGYVVKITQLDRDEFIEEHGDSGIAYWYDEGKGGTIVLNKSRPIRKRLEDLMHELDHCWTDYKEHFVDRVTKRKTR
jgi:Zn-dependent peptidase ImmA (M78 family)